MRLFQRTMVFFLVLALAVWLFYIGREHQVFVDNRTIEVEGQNYRALKYVKVTVGDNPEIELMPRDRDLAKVAGPSFRLKVEVFDEFGEEIEKVIEKELRPGFAKDMMLSMPLLAAEREDYILPPPTGAAPAPEPESSDSEETGMDAFSIPMEDSSGLSPTENPAADP